MNAHSVVAYLLELNVLNIEAIKRELRHYAARAIHPQTKQWLNSVAYNYIVNLEGEEAKAEFQNYTAKRPKNVHSELPDHASLPPWAQQSVAAKKKIHVFDVVQPTRRQLWKKVEVIVDWFNTMPATDARIRRSDRISFQSAASEAQTWREQMDSGNIWTYVKDRPPVVKQYDDGFKWVKLSTPLHIQREGFRNKDNSYPDTSMGHCIAGGQYTKQMQSGSYVYYSLRDPSNNPHITLEVRGNDVIQIKGKADAKPLARYQPYLVDFLREKAWRIRGDEDHVDWPDEAAPAEPEAE